MSEIRFEDVRVGDRVRWTADQPALRIVVEGEVSRATSRWMDIGGSTGYVVNRDDKGTFELLYRPVPPAVCGDIREDPQTGARFVRTNYGDDSNNFYQWRRITFGEQFMSMPADLTSENADIIARLVPVTP